MRISVPLSILPLTTADLDDVMMLESLSFPSPWSRSTYVYELTRSVRSRYLKVSPTVPVDGVPRLIAQGGTMLFGQEMHIVTIAVLPAWRGRSIGEWLLLALLQTGKRAGAEVATLEVRASNRIAQGMYKKLGFAQVGYRRRYYPDKEDALILTLENLHTGSTWRLLDQRFRDLSNQMERGVIMPSSLE